jgi:predicted NBD/HSP70 family sugar kinase/antitoxin (DNA-binding transcriptional repressor) of toxin-antitoxin stability system
MQTLSIRELSGEVITTATARGQALGITNKGSLVGVLVPLTREVLERLAHRDAADIRAAVDRAEQEMASDQPPSALSELVTGADRSSRTDFSRITIRDLSGKRLGQAANEGKALVVTSGGVTVALLIPVTASWMERLVEEGVRRFLDGDTADQVTERAESHLAFTDPFDVIPEAAVRSGIITQLHSTVAMPSPRAPWVGSTTPTTHAGSGREFLRQVAIGIRITSDASNSKRLVGVVTDMLARVINGPAQCVLESTDESYVLAQILSLIDDLRPFIAEDQRLVGLGLEIGGHVHHGRVVYSPNAHWTQFPLADRLTDILRLPVVLENDANALAIYERRFAGIAEDSFAVILLTELGIGCGLILDGQIYHGARGMAGEIGHIPVVLGDGEQTHCRCVNRGCLESVATPRAIELALPRFEFNGTYEQAVHASDLESVRGAFEAAGASFGRSIVGLINLINPSAIVLYGPAELLGAPRTFHIESDLPATGVARHYTGSMIRAIRQHAFSTGAADVQFIVRTIADVQSARAAAACLIDRVALAPSVRLRRMVPNTVVMR